jgi:hypothetical protein
MTGTNGMGACLVVIALMPVVLAVNAVNWTGPAYLLPFGLGAVAADLLARRFDRCPLGDTKKGSQFLHLPVWVLGAICSVVGLVALLADKL